MGQDTSGKKYCALMCPVDSDDSVGAGASAQREIIVYSPHFPPPPPCAVSFLSSPPLNTLLDQFRSFSSHTVPQPHSVPFPSLRSFSPLPSLGSPPTPSSLAPVPWNFYSVTGSLNV